MIQDFALLATPANVRRLLLLHETCQLDLPSEVIALAEQDRLDESVFDPMVCPYHLAKYTIAQFLLDCGLRGVVQSAYHPEFNPLALLNTIRLTKPEHVIILSGRRRLWTQTARAFNLPVQIMQSVGSLERQIDTIDRNSVIVFDAEEVQNPFHLRSIVREFPRIIIYDGRDFDHLIHWIVLARMMFPSMPHPLMPRMIKNARAEWSKPLVNFAPLYNVCIFPHLITTPSIQMALDDDYLMQRIKYNTGMLTA